MPRSRRIVPSLAAALLSLFGVGSPAIAQEPAEPAHYVLAKYPGGRWDAESRVQVSWDRGKPVMTGLECAMASDRTAQNGKPAMTVTISHRAESADFRFRFDFDLQDGQFIDRRLENITVGGRSYQVDKVQSRVVPWFGVYGEGDFILSYGMGTRMFRPNETYPWLPLEFLIPQFFEVEGISLGTSGEFEVTHGEYERRFEAAYVHMDGFKEAMAWCYEAVNPSGNKSVPLPPELEQALRKKK